MSGKARERESDEKVCKGKVCGRANRGKSEGGRQRDEQGATKERKGAEFLKGLHLRAGFGIMER